MAEGNVYWCPLIKLWEATAPRKNLPPGWKPNLGYFAKKEEAEKACADHARIESNQALSSSECESSKNKEGLVPDIIQDDKTSGQMQTIDTKEEKCMKKRSTTESVAPQQPPPTMTTSSKTAVGEVVEKCIVTILFLL